MPVPAIVAALAAGAASYLGGKAVDAGGRAVGLWGGEDPYGFNVPQMQSQQSYIEGPSLSLSYLRSLMGQQPMPAMPLTNSTPVQKALGGFR